MPQGTNNSGSARLRDPFFFDRSTGAVSRYTRGILLANIAYMSCAVISVLIALAISRQCGRPALHSGSGSLLLRKHPNDQYGRPLPFDPSGASSLEFEAALRDSSNFHRRESERSWRSDTEDRIRYALLHYGNQTSHGQGVGLLTDQLMDEEVRTVHGGFGHFDRLESTYRPGQLNTATSRTPEMLQVTPGSTTQRNTFEAEEMLHRPVAELPAAQTQSQSQPLTPATALDLPLTSSDTDMMCTAESPAVPFPVTDGAYAGGQIDPPAPISDADQEKAEDGHVSLPVRSPKASGSTQVATLKSNEEAAAADPQGVSVESTQQFVEGETFEMLADHTPSNTYSRSQPSGLRGTFGTLGLGRIRTQSDSDDASLTPHASPALPSEKESFWSNWFGSKGRSRKGSGPDADLELKGQVTPPKDVASTATPETVSSNAALASEVARRDPNEQGGSPVQEPSGDSAERPSPQGGSPASHSRGSVGVVQDDSISVEQPQSSTPPTQRRGGSSHPAVSELAQQERILESPAPSADTEHTRSSSDDSEEMRLWATFPEQSRRHPPGLIALEFQQRREEEENLRRRQEQQGYLADAPRSGSPDQVPGQPSLAGAGGSALEQSSNEELLHDGIAGAASSSAFSKHLYGRSPSEGGLMAIREESLGGSSVTTHNTSASMEMLASLSHSSPQQRDRDRFRSNRASLDASLSADRSVRSGSDSPTRARDSQDESL